MVLALVSAACTGGSSTTPSPTLAPSTRPSPSLEATALRIAHTTYSLPAPVQREVAVTDGSTVYLAGGLDSSDASVGGVFSLDARTGDVTSLGSTPNVFHDAAGAMIGGKLVIFGGGSSAGTDDVQAFDPTTKTASVIGHLPVPLSDLSAAVVGQTVYLVGGYDGNTPRAEIYATTDGRRFRTIAALPLGLRYAAVTAVGATVVIAGGQTATGQSDEVFALDTTTGALSRLGTLNAPVSEASGFTLGNTAYIAGGRDTAGLAVATVTAIDLSSGAIGPAGRLPRPVADAPAVAAADGVLLIGGWRGTAVTDVLSASLVPEPSASATPSDSPSTVSASAQTRPFAGLLLIADRGNNRLIVVNAMQHTIWRYPSPNLPAPPFRFYFPDDAFWVHGGRAILVNEEENHTLALIAYPSGETLWTYGHAGMPGSGTGYLHQPDDVYPYPGGGLVVADAQNCRLLFFDAAGHPTHQIGTTGVCDHHLPATVGYPNGDTPLSNGHLLVSELNGGWVDEITATGHVVWSLQLPQATTPSDPQRLVDGSYLVANYENPGGIVRFDRSGKVLWWYHPTSGSGALDHPSLAVPLPNGLVAAVDDHHHRVVIIDPATDTIVWQYGTGVAGSGRGQLSFPDGLDLLLPGNVIPLHIDFPSPVTRPGRP
jgi:hypothetical protein